MPLSVGTGIGPYDITAPLGAGGMGEVYRAHDTKLNRDVALKVLPASVAADPDRLARFSREAQTLAALNHPNIATIHGIEEFPGGRALVMELVSGEDLSAVIQRGRLPIDETLSIARQIGSRLVSSLVHGHHEVVFAQDGRLMALPYQMRGDALDVGTPVPLFAIPRGPTELRYSVSSDGQRFLMLENDPSRETAEEIRVMDDGLDGSVR